MNPTTEHEKEDELIGRAARWAERASEAIREAGGVPSGVLAKFSEESIAIMVRNGLEITRAR